MQRTTFRPLLKSSAVKPTVLYTSSKSNRTMYIESMSEMIYAMKLDQDRGVASFESQPESFEYVLGDKPVRYTPDFHVVDSNGESSFIEIKGSRYAPSERDIEKFRILRESFDRIGIYFRVVLVDFSANESKNLMFLNRYKSHDHLLIRKAIPSFYGKINDLINKGLSDDVLSSLYSAMARGDISYKKDQKIDLNMEVIW